MDGKTRVCGLIANPVEHSMSPMMHNFFAQRTGVNLAYVPFKVEEDRVGDAVKGAYALNILGMNVTVPHKQRVMEFLSELDEDARAIGAVNTLVRTKRGIRAIIRTAQALSGLLRKPVSGQKENTVYSLGPEARPRQQPMCWQRAGLQKSTSSTGMKPGPGSWPAISTC